MSAPDRLLQIGDRGFFLFANTTRKTHSTKIGALILVVKLSLANSLEGVSILVPQGVIDKRII